MKFQIYKMNAKISFLMLLSLGMWQCQSVQKKEATKISKQKSKPSQTKSVEILSKNTAGNSNSSITPEQQAKEFAILKQLPEVEREFRGVWVATVANINWPSKNTLSVAQQKHEAIEMLDYLQTLNINAVIFQVRPASDALYASKLEPWSSYLMGTTGKAPEPFYDPLQFWISEAHKRNIELHVWLNPYRAHHTQGGQPNPNSIVYKKPELVLKLKNGMYWLNPALQATKEHVTAVVKDLVSRYDIDGLHFDDYFYPYQEYNNGKDFPDDESWKIYLKSGGTLSRADWRRGHVNSFVKKVYDEIKALKPEVKFGISPFGIWKAGQPAGIVGTSQYDALFADAKLWLNEGWVDYFAPQLYWPMDSKGQPFPALLKWWINENYKGRYLWPGINTVEVKVSDRSTEIQREIRNVRENMKTNPGLIHWSYEGLFKNPKLSEALKNNFYQKPALIPEFPWLNKEILPAPKISSENKGQFLQIRWTDLYKQKPAGYILYLKYGNSWDYELLPRDATSHQISIQKNNNKLNAAVLRAYSKTGILGISSILDFK